MVKPRVGYTGKDVEDLQALADLLSEHFNKPKIKIEVREIREGKGGGRLGRLAVIPAWTLRKYNIDFAYYYTIHEWVHAVGYNRHNNLFKTMEDLALQLFDITIRRKKVYPKVVYKKDVIVYGKENPFARVHL